MWSCWKDEMYVLSCLYFYEWHLGKRPNFVSLFLNEFAYLKYERSYVPGWFKISCKSFQFFSYILIYESQVTLHSSIIIYGVDVYTVTLSATMMLNNTTLLSWNAYVKKHIKRYCQKCWHCHTIILIVRMLMLLQV